MHDAVVGHRRVEHGKAVVMLGRKAKIAAAKLDGLAHPFFRVEVYRMKRIRQLDKLVDELAQGKPMEKVLRS